ncbi:MAG TPA: hypothetical protein VEJ87_08795 [Acidimicrobiales bacterium]|nr:hypothetical protein [Acidimicrobiales bacterium]
MVRSECTDRFLILNERRLRRMLECYVRHYDEHRPQRALALRSRSPQGSLPSKPVTVANVRRRGVLGELVNEYHAA